MEHGLGFIDLEEKSRQTLADPFGLRVFPMCPERSVTQVFRPDGIGGLDYFFAAAFPGAGDAANLHGGSVSALGDTSRGLRWLLLSSALKATRSSDCIFFHAVTVAL